MREENPWLHYPSARSNHEVHGSKAQFHKSYQLADGDAGSLTQGWIIVQLFFHYPQCFIDRDLGEKAGLPLPHSSVVQLTKAHRSKCPDLLYDIYIPYALKFSWD